KNTYTNVLKLHAGDALTGTGMYRLFGVHADVDMMHEVCYDVFNIGNHEFDDGDHVLAEFVTHLTDIHSPCQNTRVLSSNLVPASTSPLYPIKEKGYIAPFVVRNFKGGHKVGIIGVDIRNKTLTGSSPDEGTTLVDERQAVRQQVRALQNRGINKIILVSHMGIARDLNWVTRIEGIDVVVGGHSHTLLAKNVGTVLTPHDRYPVVSQQQTSSDPLCIVQAWKFGHGIGRLKVEFDAAGRVVMCGGNYIIPFEPDPDASVEDATTVTNYLHNMGPTFKHTTQDKQTLDKLQAYLDATGDDFFTRLLTYEADPLCNEAIPGEGGSDVCGRQGAFTNHHGGPACNLVAQAVLDRTVEADVAIQNAGGCRSDIQGGNFSYGQAMEFLPFSDTLVTLEMAGFQIHTVLEQALELAFNGESSGSYPYASGLRFDVNASESLGYRISNLQLNARLQEGTWNDLDWSRTYTVVTNSFLAAGRDGYFEFINAEGRSDTNVTYLDAFVDYIQQMGGIHAPNPEDMSTQHFVGDEDAAIVDDPLDKFPMDVIQGDSNEEVTGPTWVHGGDASAHDNRDEHVEDEEIIMGGFFDGSLSSETIIDQAETRSSSSSWIQATTWGLVLAQCGLLLLRPYLMD
ncbi:NAD 5'-nucleotidase (Partial), partial [Seminavis robusta]